jgi:hypothetical protein
MLLSYVNPSPGRGSTLSIARPVLDDAMVAYIATSLRMHVHQHTFVIDTLLRHAAETRRQ